ncbi:hypothetical protein TNCV_4180781 [Trichonephila clavipes]|nr:hypothetical protein TNCV_4180781 [Trichonephila clavipes]
MSEPDLSASTLRKQCVFQWQGRFTMSASDVGLVSSMLRHHLVGAEASALKIVVLSHSPTQDKRNSELVAKRPCREVTCKGQRCGCTILQGSPNDILDPAWGSVCKLPDIIDSRFERHALNSN